VLPASLFEVTALAVFAGGCALGAFGSFGRLVLMSASEPAGGGSASP
jgi:hypothetical protein